MDFKNNVIGGGQSFYRSNNNTVEIMKQTM